MDNDQTTMMGGSPGPAGAGNLASAGENCPHCQTDIVAGEQFCPKCGYQRGTWPSSVAKAFDGQAAAQPGGTPHVAAGPPLWILHVDGGGEYPLAAGEHVIGRGEVEIRIADGYASRRHALLAISEDKLTLTDMSSSNGTYFEGERIGAEEPISLDSGAEFRIGNTSFAVNQVEQPAAETSAAEPELESSSNEAELPQGNNEMDSSRAEQDTPVDPASQPEVGKEGHPPSFPSESHWQLEREGTEPIAIPLGETTLGRKSDKCSVCVDGDSYVSGLHCRLIATEHTLEVTDLGSTNGTYVNDARLEAEQPWQLAGGDRLRVGQTEFLVVNNKPAITPGQEAELEK